MKVTSMVFRKLVCWLLLVSYSQFPLATASDHHYYRNAVEQAIGEAASDENVDPTLLASICWHESHHKPKVINEIDGGTGSYGLCQVKMAMARAMGYKATKEGLLNPYINARIAARILKYHKARTDSIEELLAAYNAGRVRLKDGEIRNIKYVNCVLRIYQGFQNLQPKV
jgi:soluble lytic murein transglycosylase-like protein